MSSLRRKGAWWAVFLIVGQLICASLPAQEQTNPPPNIATNSIRSVQRPSKPVFKSPVSVFRELLTMNFVEQMRFLTNRSPEDRRLILAKVREYKSLKPDERELRLRVTELRWYMLMVMRLPPSARAARLGMIPPEHRELVEARLQEWDKLPANMQKELLANEAAITYFTDLKASGGRPPPVLSPERQAMLEKGIQQWQALSEDQRQKIMERFDQFFTLSQQEKQKALNTLSDPERRQIEKTLLKFGTLDPVKRAVCIHSFEKFASLSLEERQQFLKNADRWKLMTPDERQAWRNLVNKISVLPGNAALVLKPAGPPPPPRPTPAVATTNGN